MVISRNLFLISTLAPLLSVMFLIAGFCASVDGWQYTAYIASLLFGAAGAALFLSVLYAAWKIIQDGRAPMTPVQALIYTGIPVLNFYGVFAAVYGFAKAFNVYVIREGKAAKVLPEKPFHRAIVYTFIAWALIGITYLDLNLIQHDLTQAQPTSASTISHASPWLVVGGVQKVSLTSSVKFTLLGWIYFTAMLSIALAAVIYWVNVIERLANTVNYFNGGAGVSFPWSWMSIPSVIIMYMLASYVMPSIILPPIEKVVESFIDGVQGSWAQITGGEYDSRNPTLIYNLFTSLREELVGFGLAVVVSVVLGFIAGFNRGYREYIVPLNGMFMAIPPVAWAPLMMLVFGVATKGDWFPMAIIAVIFLAAVNPMILTIIEGVLQIQGTEIKAARVLGARRWQLFVYVYLPASLPFITAALRIGFSQAWRALVAAEMVGAVAGIGWSVRINSEVGNNEEMILYIIMIGFLSWLFERLLFRPLEKHYEVWRLV